MELNKKVFLLVLDLLDRNKKRSIQIKPEKIEKKLNIIDFINSDGQHF